MATAATGYRLSTEDRLTQFVRAILAKLDVAPADAAIVADVLVAADLRGIESHGVSRLQSYCVEPLRNGDIATNPEIGVVRETNTSIVIDAGNGLGHPVAKRAMDGVIAKAKAHGAAFATVRNSNHYGIAGFYAMLALEHDLVGMTSTNSVRCGAPTYGRDIMLGTNPFAYAVPTAHEPAFVLDFASTTMLAGAVVPLGGLGVDNGGHKGYGLSLLADIMCGVLAGGKFGNALPRAGDGPLPGAISHWFAAFRVDGFRDVADFKRDMDVELRGFKRSAPSPGQDRIYVAGEREHEKTSAHRRDGIPVGVPVWDGLTRLAAQLEVPFDIERR